MAKSYRKQCRKPKPKQQTGKLVVVSPRELQRHLKAGSVDAAAPSSSKKGSKGKGNLPKGGNAAKGTKRKKNSLSELLGHDGGRADIDADEFDSPLTPRCDDASGGISIGKFVFTTSQHSRQHRLCYLLAIRPALRAGTAGGTGLVDVEEGGCHAVVFVESIGVAQELLGELKAMSLTVLAVHERTPKAQAQEHMKRFLAAPSAKKSSVLILTSAATARQPSVGSVSLAAAVVVRAVHYDAPEGHKSVAARARVVGRVFAGRHAGPSAQEVHLEGSGDVVMLPPFVFNRSAMDGIHSRLVIAKRLARAQAGSIGDGEERCMQRAAAAAGLEWDGDSVHGRNKAKEVAQRERRQAQIQQATALREKLKILFCQPLLPPLIPNASAEAGGTGAARVTILPQSSKELRKKMALLGMISGEGGGGGGVSKGPGSEDDRCTAQTRWLDGSDGRLFGGEWEGSVRKGASKDGASIEMRSKLEIAKLTVAAVGRCCDDDNTRQGGGTAIGKGNGRDDQATMLFLAEWNPNPDTPDESKWGGRWGKPCGHNEVVLQHLRPFAPIEVMNTRVCSKASPAPGNTGFEGCLELLSLACRTHERALTIWDDAAFIFIDPTGTPSTLAKRALLPLPLPRIRFLMKNMRSFTVCCEGQRSPHELARAVVYAARWGAKQSRFGSLTADLSSRVLSFVLSGDVATWRSISAGVGVAGARRQSNGAKGQDGTQRETLAFASKKKRHNFNL